MPIEVNLAKLSPTMESGQMVRWLVKVGDKVKEGDTLAEIQTDKAVMPMESFDEGIVAILDVKEGDDIDLGQRVLVLAGRGEDPKEVAAKLAKRAPAAALAPEKTADKPQSKDASQPIPNQEGHGASGNGEPIVIGSRVKSSPLARKVAAAAHVDLSSIHGTGPSGRVIRRDVEAYVGQAKTTKAAVSPSASTTLLPSRPALNVTPGSPLRIPHTPMRKTIAKRMMESKQSAPEIHVTVDVRIDKLNAVRETLNKSLVSEKIKLSVSDFVTKAVALALRKHPDQARLRRLE